MKRKSNLTAVTLILFISCIIYLNSLQNSFQYDDEYMLVGNQYLRDLKGIGHFFISPQLSSEVGVKGYRPMTMASFVISYHLSDLEPLSYHLFSLLLHGLNGILLFFVSKRLLGNHACALITALLFVCHPLNTEAVDFIWARSTLLASFFYLLSLVLTLKGRDAPKPWAGLLLLGSLVAYACSLLSKEIGITMPVVLVAAEVFILREGRVGAWLRKGLRPYHAAFLLIAALFIYLITFPLKVIEATPQARPLGLHWLLQLKGWLFYLKMAFFPGQLSIDHPLQEPKSLFEPQVILSLACLMLFAMVLYTCYRAYRGLFFAGLWFCITLLPSIVFPLETVVSENRLYLPLMGWAMFMGRLSLLLGRGLIKPSQKRWWSLGLASILICFSLMVVGRNTHWRDELSLWSRVEKLYPQSFKAHIRMGHYYMSRGQFSQTLEEYHRAQEALLSFPQVQKTYSAKIHSQLGLVYNKMGLYQKAIEEYEEAIKLEPASAMLHNNLGNVYAEMKEYEKAMSLWQKALELDPASPLARANLERLKALYGALPP